MVNRERQVYIPVEDALRVIDCLPDASWRLLFAQARFGGLRVGSEPRALLWSDIDLHGDPAKGQAPSILVRVAKLTRKDGEKSHLQTRRMPLFPELRPYVEDALAVRQDGDEGLVFPGLKGRTDQSLRKTLEKAIELAGVKPWVKLWQNLRSSCQTDLAGKYPITDVCKWIGNSPQVAAQHYLQGRDAVFAQAAALGVNPRNPDS